MDIPFSTWYPAIEKRRSRRQFDSTRPIPSDVMSRLAEFCAAFRPFPHARAELITRSSDKVFTGAIGSYGKIKGAPAFIAFIADLNGRNVQEELGYTGEGIILEATALQLATCWVAGFFKPELAATLSGIKENERVLAVTPVGYATEMETLEEKIMTGFGRTHKRKPLSKMVTGMAKSSWPGWLRASLEAARRAPSAVNRQPWSFHVEPDSVIVSVRTAGIDFNISKRLDCGIAMLHIEVAALNCGVKGKWEFLEPPAVARFYGGT